VELLWNFLVSERQKTAKAAGGVARENHHARIGDCASNRLKQASFDRQYPEDGMVKVGKDQDFDLMSRIGPDATATFDNSASNPTEHASSEATNAATAVDGEDEELEQADDDAEEEEYDDEEDEEEDVEEEADAQ
jgi:hypothetical protein